LAKYFHALTWSLIRSRRTLAGRPALIEDDAVVSCTGRVEKVPCLASQLQAFQLFPGCRAAGSEPDLSNNGHFLPSSDWILIGNTGIF
jgi:hypothetical protein